MDERDKKRLSDRGLLATTPAGDPAVRVSLQYRPQLTEPSRTTRRRLLNDAFARIARRLEAGGAKVDLDSLSVSSQTVEALLPFDRFDELSDELEHAEVRVDQLVDRKVV
jgi:hypothetical protein